MKNKTVKDYNGSVKAPRLARLLDKPLVYVAFGTAAAVGIGSFIGSGWTSYQNVISEPEVISPYQEIQPVSFKGKTWAEKLVSMKPPTVKAWETAESSKAQSPINTKICNSLQEIPITLLSTHIGKGSKVESRVQVYGAGQSATQFEKYSEKLKNCFSNIKEEKISSTKVLKFTDGFLLNVGDSIIGVTYTKENDSEKLLEFYIKNAEKTLKETKCLALDPNSKDSKRSFYYDKDSYEGLYEDQKIETNVDFTNLPEPTEIKLKEVKNPYTLQPEAPLPETFPELPTEVEKPAIPNSVKNVNKFEDIAKYLIADNSGPGCGWAWSSQASPVYDSNKLATDKNEEILEVQNYVNTKTLDYINQKNNWALSIMSVMPKADSWNEFVNNTNKVHEKWDWLRSERLKIRNTWYNYVERHDSWRTFDDRKAAALDAYQKEVDKCELAKEELENWESEWREKFDENEKKRQEFLAKQREEQKESPEPTPSPTPEEGDEIKESSEPTPAPSPTPTPQETFEGIDIPEKPQGCSVDPVRPAIIDQEKPSEPQAPVLPDEVTIPNSWPQPQK